MHTTSSFSNSQGRAAMLRCGMTAQVVAAAPGARPNPQHSSCADRHRWLPAGQRTAIQASPNSQPAGSLWRCRLSQARPPLVRALPFWPPEPPQAPAQWPLRTPAPTQRSGRRVCRCQAVPPPLGMRGSAGSWGAPRLRWQWALTQLTAAVQSLPCPALPSLPCSAPPGHRTGASDFTGSTWHVQPPSVGMPRTALPLRCPPQPKRTCHPCCHAKVYHQAVSLQRRQVERHGQGAILVPHGPTNSNHSTAPGAPGRG